MKKEKRKGRGRPCKDEVMAPVHVYLPLDLFNKLHKLPGGVSISGYIRGLIEIDMESK